MRIDKFYGINNQQKPTEYGLEGAEEALNVDITDDFKLVRRNGQEKQIISRNGLDDTTEVTIDAAYASGEGEILYQRGHRLICMSSHNVGGDKVAIGLSETQFLTGYKLNDSLFWSNGVETGVIDMRTRQNYSLGIQTPEVPSVTVTAGNMPAGQYMYTIALVRADGLESSAWTAGQVVVDDLSGLSIEPVEIEPETLPPSDDESDADLILSPDNDITHVRLYLTHVDGKELYLAGQYGMGELIEYIGDTSELIHPLRNQFCQKPQPFTACIFYRGCMYYAVANTLYASKPNNFGMVDEAMDYIQFESAITVLGEAENGIYVGTEREHSFLAGATIQSMTRMKVLDYGAIRGNAKRVYASTVVPNQAGNVSLWPTNRGLVAGFDGGQVVNLTGDYFAFPDGQCFTSALREENGLRQMLVSV